MKFRVLQLSDSQYHNKKIKNSLKLLLDNSYPPNLLKNIFVNTRSFWNNEIPSTSDSAIPKAGHKTVNALTVTTKLTFWVTD